MKQIEEDLTIGEAAGRLKLSPKTVKNKMAAGIFKKGIHFYSPHGMSPRFKWSALVAWLEQADAAPSDATDSIPMARGYRLGQLGKKKPDRGLTVGDPCHNVCQTLCLVMNFAGFECRSITPKNDYRKR